MTCESTLGLGKTYTGSEKMRLYDNSVNLLVCQKSKIEDWLEHFVTYYPQYDIKDLTKNKVINSAGNGLYIGVINYDLIWRREQYKNLKDFTLMLDESSLISNLSAKRTKFILKMKPKNCILLSGTPVSGKYERLVSQAKLLGWNITKKDFYERYIIEKELMMNGVKSHIKFVIGYKNTDELIQNLKLHGAQFLKSEEVLDLPEQNFNIVDCKVTKDYKEFDKESIVTLGDVTLVGDLTLTKMLYLRQLCGQYNASKVDTLLDIIDSTDDRLIIFYNFKQELEILKSKIKRPISEVNGDKRDLKAYENESNSVTLIQYQAGSMGLNLQKANKIIYFTLPLSCDNYMQSLKRTHRIGQTQKCFYYFMICKNSIEEKIYKALKRGEDYTNKLFEDNK